MLISRARDEPSRSPLSLAVVVEVITTIFTAISGGILGFFIYDLAIDDVYAPWEFIYLTAVAAFTILSFLVLLIKGIFSKSNQGQFGLWSRFSTRYLLFLALSILWTVGLAAMTIELRRVVLSVSCEKTFWQTDDGVMVCQIYKALYSAIVVATAGCLISFFLEVRSPHSARGNYVEMQGGQTPKFLGFKPYRKDQRDSDQQPLTRNSNFEPLRGAEVPDTRAMPSEPGYYADSKSARLSTSSSTTLAQSEYNTRTRSRNRASVSLAGDAYHSDNDGNEHEDDAGAAMLKPAPYTDGNNRRNSATSSNGYHSDNDGNGREGDVGTAMLKPSSHPGKFTVDTSYRSHS